MARELTEPTCSSAWTISASSRASERERRWGGRSGMGFSRGRTGNGPAAYRVPGRLASAPASRRAGRGRLLRERADRGAERLPPRAGQPPEGARQLERLPLPRARPGRPVAAEALEEVVDPHPERGRGQPVGRQQAGAGLVLVGLPGADPEQAGRLVPRQAELEPASAQAGGGGAGRPPPAPAGRGGG